MCVMNNRLEFEFNNKKNPVIRVVFSWALAIAVFVYLLYDKNWFFNFKTIGGLVLFILCSVIIDIYKLYRYNQIKNKMSLVLSSECLKNNLDYEVVRLSEIERINYKIENITSY